MREALKLALEALESKFLFIAGDGEAIDLRAKAITAIKEALAQPEFQTHEERDEGWSEWVCPDPENYLMKCCDCGLVHEAQFGVVRYASEAEKENCDMVDDPNLQAVFRMRRSEKWSPEDTAHRAGGLPMAQPDQLPPSVYSNTHQPQQEPLTEDEIWDAYMEISAEFDCNVIDLVEFTRAIEAKLKEKNT